VCLRYEGLGTGTVNTHLRLAVIYTNSKTEYIIVSFHITFYQRTIPSLVNYPRVLVCGYLTCHTFILGENV